MIIDCIADLHGYYPKLEGGDLLIVAGDLTAHDYHEEYVKFFQWLLLQEYKRKILIAGNHDNQLKFLYRIPEEKTDLVYLCDSGTEFEGLKIWGSPWTLTFRGINPLCTAFTGTEEELEAKFELIPDDTDILITHGPPYGILDVVRQYGPFSHEREACVGSPSLLKRVFDIRPKVHVFGHIHEMYGQYDHIPRMGASKKLGITPIEFINCSHVNENYESVNKPIRIVL